VRRDDATEDTSYFTLDHLGSVDSISNSTGITYLSYDAFGKRRNASTWSGAPPSGDMTGVAYSSRRGYTEHEMLDNLGLIHMNGRMQDPHLGRFLSADPYIVGLDNSQAVNRYSYVNNNPLSFTDPSGYWPEDCDCRPGVPRGPNDDAFWLSFMMRVSLSFVHPAEAGTRVSPDVSHVNGEVDAYNAQVEVGKEERRWWGYIEIGFDVVTDFVPVVSSVKGAYEVYKVHKDPNSTKVDVAIAWGGLAPGAKIGKYAVKAADKAADAYRAAKAATSIGAKIEKQIAKRGWSRQSVDDAIANPTRTVATKDTRHLPGGGRMDDPATAYYGKDGGYVIRNDRTGDIVQVSDRTDAGWVAPWD
jgi:RHS repeat-associated protein